MRRILAIMALSVTFASSAARGDTPAPDREYKTISPNGDFEFAMYPATRAGDDFRDPRGEARRVGAEQDADPLWTVTGWYAFQTYISDDGRSLVRIGPWASLPPADELAVAFYRDGVELRRYSVADLIDDTASLPRSVSHYAWQARGNDFPNLTGRGEFRLRTLENKIFTFDAATGVILASVHYCGELPPQVAACVD